MTDLAGTQAFASRRLLPVLRWILAATLVASLAAASVIALRWGRAETVQARASRDIEQWSETGKIPELGKWLAVRESLLAAQRDEPGNASIAESLGVLHALRDPASAAFQEHALEHFAYAARRRPSSPYTWANIALARYRLGEKGPELFHALERAAALGPWEPEVQFILADVGFALWDELPAERRADVLRVAVNGSKRYAERIVAIAETRGRLAVYCAVADTTRQVPACRAASAAESAFLPATAKPEATETLIK